MADDRTMTFIVKNLEAAQMQYSKYNGFASQIMENAMMEHLSCQELGLMSLYTKAMCEFWDKMLDDAIEGRI